MTTLEGRGATLYSLEDEPPAYRPQYNNMIDTQESPPPPPIGTPYEAPMPSTTKTLPRPRERERERASGRDRDRGRVREKERDRDGRGRNQDHDYRSDDDDDNNNKYFALNGKDGKGYGGYPESKNTIARRPTSTQHRPRPQTLIRRSSSVPGPGYRNHDSGGRGKRNDERHKESTALRRTSTRPKDMTRRSSSHAGHRSSVIGYRGSDVGGNGERGRNVETTVARRPKAITRRSSSVPGGYGQQVAIARKEGYVSDGEGKGRSQSQDRKMIKRATGGNRENIQDRFSKTPTGIGAGLVGAAVGAWATRKAHGTSHVPKEKQGNGNAFLTLVGATVGGMAVNAVVDRLEEKNMVKQVGKGEVVTVMRYTGRAASAVIDHLAEERMQRMREQTGGGQHGGSGGRGHGGYGHSRGHGGGRYEEDDYRYSDSRRGGGRDRY